eukprot:gene122-115_t
MIGPPVVGFFCERYGYKVPNKLDHHPHQLHGDADRSSSVFARFWPHLSYWEEKKEEAALPELPEGEHRKNPAEAEALSNALRMVSVTCWALCILCWCFLYFTLPGDKARARRSLALLEAEQARAHSETEDSSLTVRPGGNFDEEDPHAGGSNNYNQRHINKKNLGVGGTGGGGERSPGRGAVGAPRMLDDFALLGHRDSGANESASIFRSAGNQSYTFDDDNDRGGGGGANSNNNYGSSAGAPAFGASGVNRGDMELL